jgi:hypothetical protein
MSRSIRFAGRLFVFSLLATVAIFAAMAGPARADIVLNGTPQTFEGTVSGEITPGINGSIFYTGNYGNLDLDGASYTVPTDRILAGTVGLLGLTPSSSVLNYTGQMSGFGMFSGYPDQFSTGWSGTFTPQETGDYTFRWSNDDRGSMYIDLNNDGIFQSGDRVGSNAWNSSGTKVLTEDIAYKYIVCVHR